MKGFKVCNYKEWKSLPEIFPNITEAKKARLNWEHKKGSVIEMFNSKTSYVKTIKVND